MTQESNSLPAREAYLAQIRSIRSDYPNNLMARHFKEDYVHALDLANQSRLWKIVRSGFENRDSNMGAYIQSSKDYEDFQALLDPMIRDHHGIDPLQEIRQQHDWSAVHSNYNLEDIDPALSEVSMRVRVGRNLATLPLTGAMSKTERVIFENHMIQVFKTFVEDPEFGGVYLSLTPDSKYAINAGEYKSRVDNRQMFKDMRRDRFLVSGGIASDWPYGRGMYISGSDDFIVWVGEEDHLRIMAMRKGGNLSGLLDRLQQGLEKLTNMLDAFAHSPRYGYLTSCPSNLGTAMRASLHLPLPAFLAELEKVATQSGLAIRGVAGEHTDISREGIIDISPSARMGVTESEIIRCLFKGTAALWKSGKIIR